MYTATFMYLGKQKLTGFALRLPINIPTASFGYYCRPTLNVFSDGYVVN